MSRFYLKDLDTNRNQFTVTVGNDGDIHLTVWAPEPIHHMLNPYSVRIGMGPNSGDPNGDVEDIKYLKGALRNLAMEFKYQNGEITKEEIQKYRDAPKVPSYLEKWFE